MSGILKYKQLIEIQTIKNYFTQKTMLIERKNFCKKVFFTWMVLYLSCCHNNKGICQQLGKM